MGHSYRHIGSALRGGSALHYSGRFLAAYEPFVLSSVAVSEKQRELTRSSQTVFSFTESAFTVMYPAIVGSGLIVRDTPTDQMYAEPSTVAALTDPAPTVAVESSTTATFEEEAVISYEEGANNRGSV